MCVREGGRREILPMKNVHLSVCVTSKEAKNIDATKIIKNVDQLPCRMFYLVDLFYCLDVTLTHPCDICVFCKIEAKSQGFSGLRLSILTSAPCGGSGMSQCITGGPKRLLFSLLVVLGLSPVLGW